MKKRSIIRKVFDKLFPINTKRRKFIKKRVVNIIEPLNNCGANDSKIKMYFRLLFMMIMHPLRGCSLIHEIKKGNIKYGDHHADICYLCYGKIDIPKEEKPLVSIIIPVYNQYVYTYKCLKSIAEYTNDVSYEIIIADDVSTDGTKFLSSYVKNITIIRNEINLKFLKNCNNAVKYAKGKYIFFLNNDTQVTKNWLSSLIDLIESDVTIGMVGSKLIFPNGLLQEAGGIICKDGISYNYGKFDDANKPQYNYVRDVDYISGAAIMISKKLWNSIGGFDELFAPAYCEDSDLAFEVRKRGFRVVYQPKSVVIHFEGVSNGVDVNDNTSLKYYQIENNIKLKEKWKKEFELLPSSNLDKMNIHFRDRIRHKKTILVIDHFVPEHDKDAGSKTTFQYLKMFVEKGFIVKFLPDNYYQSEPYTTELQQMGIEVLYGIDYKNSFNDWIIINKENIDVVYLNRPHISIKYIDFIKENTDIKIIYYGHDLHFLREKREYDITHDSKHLVDSDYWKEIELNLMHKSDKVYYPSHVEETLIKSIDKNIDVKAINAYVFDNIDVSANFDSKNRDGIMFVGGFNHRPNVDAVLWFIENVYSNLKNNIPFYVVGSNPPKEILELKKVPGVIVKGYVSDNELDNLYSHCKIAVVPLRYGAGIKGKVIEAMSKGMPIITTSTGAEGINEIEKILPVVDNPNDFLKELMLLYNDDSRLENISLKERKYINNNFGTESAWKIIEKDFEKQYKYLVVTPDGYGSKGDEAMLEGILNFVEPYSTRIITPRADLWKNHIDEIKDLYVEEYYELEKFSNSYKNEKVVFILGADLIDGTNGIDNSISRLKLAEKVAENGNSCNIFCSFKSNTSNKIIKIIKSLPDSVNFYLRDELSYKYFVNLTRKKCSYFPDFGYFSKGKVTENVLKINNELKQLKVNYNLIGINFSETSFRSLYQEYNNENRKKYVESIIDLVIEKIDDPYLVFICHDTRHWDGYASDNDYNEIALEICNKRNIKNIKKLEENLSHAEITEILKNLDTLITGRMHLSIAAFKAGIIPIIYTGNNKQMFSMGDKMKGMFINRIGDDSFVTHDIETLELVLKKIIYNYYDCLKLLEYSKRISKKDYEYEEQFKENIKL